MSTAWKGLSSSSSCDRFWLLAENVQNCYLMYLCSRRIPTHARLDAPLELACARPTQRCTGRVIARRASATPVAPPRQAVARRSPRSRSSAAPHPRHHVLVDRYLVSERPRWALRALERRTRRARSLSQPQHVVSIVLHICGVHARAQRRARCLVDKPCWPFQKYFTTDRQMMLL